MKNFTKYLTLILLCMLVSTQLWAVDPPTTQAYGISLTNVGTTTVRLGFNRGDGMKRLVVIKAGNNNPTNPGNNNFYTPNANYGSGGTTGAGSYVVFYGNQRSVDVTGLTANTQYTVKVYECNYSGTSEIAYLTTDGDNNPRSFYTLLTAPTNLSITNLIDKSFEANWTDSDYSTLDYFEVLVYNGSESYDQFGYNNITASTFYEDFTGLNQNTSYSVKVRAWSYQGYEVPSAWTNVVTTTTKNSPSISSNISVCSETPYTGATCDATGTCYWQTRENGTSTANPITSSLSSGGTRYVRTQFGSGLWSDYEAPTYITILYPPTSVAVSPASNSVCLGSATTFTSSFDGTNSNVKYQWYHGSTVLTGQTNSTYVFTPNLGDAGTYSVVVTNDCGSGSGSGTLTVNQITAITSTPVNVTTCAGTSASFSVSANGSSLTYSWVHNSTVVGTSNKLNLTNVSASDEGTYTVTVHGICGSDVQASATLTVNPVTAITSPLTNVITCAGTNASFGVSASGTGTLTYTWYHGTTQLSNTTKLLSLTNVQAGDAGTYKVVVHSDCGSDVSSSATLTVNPITSITSNPVNVTTCAGTSASFGVSATGTGTLTYSWVHNSTVVGTSATLNLSNVSSNDAGTYTVTVHSACGDDLQASATLTVNPVTAITTNLLNVSTCAGTTATFKVTATGTGTLTYKWYQGTTLLSNTSNLLTLTNVQAGDAGTYKVVVHSDCGTDVSSSATLTVNPIPVLTEVDLSMNGSAISGNISNGYSVCMDQNDNTVYSFDIGNNHTGITSNTTLKDGNYPFVFTGYPSNYASFTYAKQGHNSYVDGILNGTIPMFLLNVSGNGTSFKVIDYAYYYFYSTISPLKIVGDSPPGDYILTGQVVSAANCMSDYINIKLKINQIPVISQDIPTSVFICNGDNYSYSVTASATPAITYQWYNSTGPISGATSNNYTASAAGSYHVVVSNTCGDVSSATSVLTLNTLTSITKDPVNTGVCVNHDAMFSVVADGTNLHYQWKFGTNKVGTDSPNLTLTSVSTDAAGNYSVIVSGTCGTKTSNTVTLTVNTPVTAFMLSGDNAEVCSGTKESYTVSDVNGSLPHTTEWYLDGELQSNTTDTYTVTADWQGATKTVKALVSNSCNSTPVEHSYTLAVYQNPTFASATVDNDVICDHDISIFTASADGTPELHYQWYDANGPIQGEINNTLQTGTGGTYYFTVTNDCQSASMTSNSITLTVKYPPVWATDGQPQSQTICYGAEAKFIALVTGSDLEYTWYNADDQNNWIQLQDGFDNTYTTGVAGNFDLVINGFCGGIGTDAGFSLTVLDPITVDIAPTSPLCNGDANGTATALPYGGDQDYTYQWDDAGQQTSHTATGLTAGTYNVVVTDGHGCTGSGSITITEPDALTATYYTPGIKCNGGNTVVTITGHGGTEPYISGTGEFVQSVGSKTYTVTDENQCTTTIKVTLSEPTLLVASATATDILCHGGLSTVTVTAKGGTPNADGMYSGTGTHSVGAGTYSYTVTDNNGCTSTASITINQPDELIADAQQSAPILCNGGTTSVIVSAKGGTEPYTNTGEYIVKAGVHSYTVTDKNGCKSTIEITVDEPTLLVASSKATSILCNGGDATVTISATGGTPDYNGTGDITAKAGTHIYTVTDKNGCTAKTTITITEPTLLQASATGNNVLCHGGTTTVTVSATGGTPTYTGTGSFVVSAGTHNFTVKDLYHCESIATITITEPAELVASSDVTIPLCHNDYGTVKVTATGGTPPYSGTGTFSVKADASYSYTVSDANNCVSINTITGTMYNPRQVLAIAGDNRAICNGSETVLGTTAIDGDSYSWTSIPTGFTSSVSNPTVKPTETTTYTLVETIIATGCSATNSVTVTVNPISKIMYQPVNATACLGKSAEFSVQAVGTGTLHYSWKHETTPVGTDSPTLSLSSLSVADAGNYSVVVSSDCGFEVSKTVTLTVNTPVTAFDLSNGNKVVCSGTVETYNVSNVNGTLSHHTNWYLDGELQSNTTDTYTVTADWQGATKEVKAVVYNDCNNQNIENSYTLGVYENPSYAWISGSIVYGSDYYDLTNPICHYDEVILTAMVDGSPTPGLTYQWFTDNGDISGATDNTLELNEPNQAGYYNFRATNGCVSIQPDNYYGIEVRPELNWVTIPTDQIICSYSYATFNASTDQKDVVYNWYDAYQQDASGHDILVQANSQTFVTNIPSTYYVNAQGICDGYNSYFELMVLPELTVDITSTNPLCNGDATGTATATAAGGDGNYTYSWSNGQTDATATGLVADNYTVTVTDDMGCSVIGKVTITQPPVVTVSATTTNVSCFGGNNGSITVDATGGSGNLETRVLYGTGYKYQASMVSCETFCAQCQGVCFNFAGYVCICFGNSSSNQNAVADRTKLEAGSYTVVAVDATNGCVATTEVTISQPTELTASVSGDNVKCNGSTTFVTVSAQGGTPSSTSGYNGTGTFEVTAGSYSYTVTDANGCSKTVSITITEPAKLVASSTATQILCNNDNTTITVTATGGTTPYSGTGNFTKKAGAYSYTVTDNNGCTSTTYITITEPTVLTAKATGNNVLCHGGTTTVTVTADGGTLPYNGTGTHTVGAGTYYYTVKDANGCSTTASITITEPTELTAKAIGDNVKCNGETTNVTVTANGGTPGYDGTGTFKVGAGTHNYLVKDANGCETYASITISEPAKLVASSTATQIMCNNDNTTITVSATGGTTPYSGSGNFSKKAGTYSYTVTDNNGCTSTTDITITEPTVLTAKATGDNVLCHGGTTTVTVTADGGTTPYNGTGTHTVGAGTYYYTVKDANGCSTTASITISEPTALTASVSGDNVKCNGGTTQVTVSASGGVGPYTGTGTTTEYAGTHSYTVTDANNCSKTVSITITEPAKLTASVQGENVYCNGGTTQVTVSATGGTTPYSGTGTFTVNAGNYDYTVTDANGCSSKVSITITEPTKVTLETTTANVSCYGGNNGSIKADAKGGSGNLETHVYYGSGIHYEQAINNCSTFCFQCSGVCLNFGIICICITNNSSSLTEVADRTKLSAGTYTVFAIDATYGCVATSEVTITEPTELTASVSGDNIKCNGGTTQVTVSATGGTSPLTGTGNYTVSAGTHSYTVTDANNCSKTISITITEPAKLVASSTATQIMCNNDNTTITVSATGGTTPYSGTGVFSKKAGTYSYTVTDNNGCTSTTDITITEPTVLTAKATGDNVLCHGGTTTVNVTADGGTLPYDGTGTHTVGAGTYYYTVKDANGCSTTASITITQPDALVASAAVTNPSCYQGNGTVVISATGGNGSYSGTGTFTVQAGQTYSYTVTDGNNCQSNTISGTMFAPTQVVASAVVTNPLCAGGNGTVVVTAVGGSGVYTSGTGTFTVTAGQTYSYTVTDTHGCNSNTISGTMFSPTAVVASQTHTDISCYGVSSGSITISATGGKTPYSGTGTFTGLAAGTYNYSVSDANGCSTNISVTLTQPELVKITDFSIPTNKNVGDAVTFSVTATGGGSSLHYQWKKNNSNISGATNSTYTISSIVCTDKGTYSVEVHSGDCSQTASVSGVFNVYMTTPTGAYGIQFTYWTRTSITFNINSANSTSRLVIAKPFCYGTCATYTAGYVASAFKSFLTSTSTGWSPVNGQVYSANSSWGTPSSFVRTPSTDDTICAIYNGTGTTGIQVTNLTRNSWYAFAVYEYSTSGTGNSDCGPNYSDSVFTKAQKSSLKESQGEDGEVTLIQAADNFGMTEISPNPANTDISFSIITGQKLPFSFEIYSIEGVQVYNEQKELNSGTTPFTINLKSEKGVLPTGMYILKVRTGNDELTRRFIYMP